ncbi:hypothetical protein ACFVJ4_37440 [Streptomyces sp. NPDC127178]
MSSNVRTLGGGSIGRTRQSADGRQLKSCSSSEVAAMIEGLLRH